MRMQLSSRFHLTLALLAGVPATLLITCGFAYAHASIIPTKERAQMVATLRKDLQASHDLLTTGNVDGVRTQLTASADYIKSLEPQLSYTALAKQIAACEQALADDDTATFFNHLQQARPLAKALARQNSKIGGKITADLDDAGQQMHGDHHGGAARLIHDAQTDLAQLPGYLPLANVNASIDAARLALAKLHPDIAAAKTAIDNALLQFGVAFNE